MAQWTDEQIRSMARKRVGFKQHLAAYAIVNLGLAAIWMMSSGWRGGMPWGGDAAHYWPMWTHLGWGIGLALHAFFAFGGGEGMLEREERRLRERNGRT